LSTLPAALPAGLAATLAAAPALLPVFEHRNLLIFGKPGSHEPQR
jgi:hypothetical protein